MSANVANKKKKKKGEEEPEEVGEMEGEINDLQSKPIHVQEEEEKKEKPISEMDLFGAGKSF